MQSLGSSIISYCTKVLWRLAVSAAICCTGVASAQAPLGVIHSNGTGNWGTAATWTRVSGTGTLPTIGDHVIITSGHTVTLDTPTGIGDFAHIEVFGVLKVADTQAYIMQTSRIDVGPAAGGNPCGFEIGTATTPFVNRFILVLTDNWLSATYGGAGGLPEHKSFYVHSGATLDLHGDRNGSFGGPRPSWIRLKDLATVPTPTIPYTTPVGANALILDAATGWNTFDRVAITSTDFDQHQAEDLEITAVTGATLGVKLFGTASSGLVYKHHAHVEAGGVDERAEVGLLSRNITVSGDPGTSTTTTRHGGHLFIRKDNPADPVGGVARIDWTEFQLMGWHGALGRYPIHIHELGSSPGTYVTSSSVHHSFNRAIAIHHTNDVTISENVMYDTWGHAYYWEAGDEINVVATGNLGFVTRRPDPSWASVAQLGDTWPLTGQPFFTESDSQVSTYWVTNYLNYVQYNVAAGSDDHGFWYDLLQNAVAWGTTQFPHYPTSFVGNTAHSNGQHGFFQEVARGFTVDLTLANPFEGVNDFVDFTAYKNRQAAVWHRAYGQTRWLRAKVADNLFGFYLASEGLVEDFQIHYLNPTLSAIISAVLTGIGAPFFHPFPFTGAPGQSIQVLEDCDIVGETSNVGNLSASTWESDLGRTLPDVAHPEYMIKGIELYDGLIAAVNCRFDALQDHTYAATPPASTALGCGALRPAAAISIRGQHSTFKGNMWTVDARNLVYLCSFSNYVSHKLLFPVPYSTTTYPYLGNQGEKSALVFDVNGSIDPTRPLTYYVNNTNLLRPAGASTPIVLADPCWAQPLAVPGPGQYHTSSPEGDVAYACVEIFIVPNQGSTFGANDPTGVTVTRPAVTAGPNSITVRDTTVAAQFANGLTPAPLNVRRDFPFTVLTRGVPISTGGAAAPEVYTLAWESLAPGGPHSAANDPRDFVLDFQATAAGRQVIFSIPYDGGGAGPTTVKVERFGATWTLTTPIVTTATLVTGSTAFTGSGNEYYYDATTKRLWLNPVAISNLASGYAASAYLPLLDGRMARIVVDG